MQVETNVNAEILSEDRKNDVLNDLATLLSEHREAIIEKNQADIANCTDLDDSLMDRLKVNDAKVDGMITSIQEVIGIKDPTGKKLDEYEHPNGLQIVNKTVPFGNILIIYESRPDVTIEAAASAFKAGNKIILKGGKEARLSNLLLVDLWHKALAKHGVSESYVTYLDMNREAAQKLIKENTHKADLIIPRGGDGLINFVKSNTSVPVLVSGRGNNFIYIHDDADAEMAINLVLNGKSRLSVCNAIDKVLINRDLPNIKGFLNNLTTALVAMGIEVQGDQTIKELTENITENTEGQVWYEEFLAAKILLGVTDNSADATQKINEYSGGHSAVIVCKDQEVASAFQNNVDCAAVYHNASSRFTDGGQFGFGAEMAISTQKLHFRGPLGLTQLVTNKWFINGNGQVR